MRAYHGFLAIALVAASPAAANDSMVSIEVGGLVLERTDAIRMASEDLRIGMDRVSVDYLFENLTDKAVEARIGFPMPVFEGGSEYDFDSHAIDLETPLWPFVTEVDGQMLPAEIDMRVTDADGNDITAILAETSLLPGSYADIPDSDAVWARRDRLSELGTAAGLPDLAYGSGGWRYTLTYLWDMSIPARSQISVHHEYVPLVGGFGLAPDSLTSRGRSYKEFLEEAYCASEAQWNGILRARRELDDPVPGYLFDVGYVLTTGANWAGPIGEFTLTIEANDPQTMVMLCWEGAFETISPTERRFRAQDFSPERDIAVGFFRIYR
jgi:hypothetical protein